MNLEQLIQECLAQPEPSAEALSELERMGDVAFDRLVHLVQSGELSEETAGLALRRLAFMTRQWCYSRKPELLELVLTLIGSASRSLRSVAVHVGVINYYLLDENRKAEPWRTRMRSLVGEALARGLDGSVEPMAKRFLRNTLRESGSGSERED